jgi:hypothetical protein
MTNAGKLKFIWKGWRNPCPVERIGKLYSAPVSRENVNRTELLRNVLKR